MRIDSQYTYLEVVIACVVTINQVFALYRLVVVKLSFREPVANESEDIRHGGLKTESNVLSNNCKLPRELMAVLIWDSVAGHCVFCGDLCQVVTPWPVLQIQKQRPVETVIAKRISETFQIMPLVAWPLHAFSSEPNVLTLTTLCMLAASGSTSALCRLNRSMILS